MSKIYIITGVYNQGKIYMHGPSMAPMSPHTSCAMRPFADTEGPWDGDMTLLGTAAAPVSTELLVQEG